MNEILSFLKDFGSLLNAAVIISLVGVTLKLMHSAVKRKDVEIELLKERLETFSVDNVAERFRFLKEYYEKHMREWHDASIRTLEEEKRKAIEQKEDEFRKKIEDEIRKRNKLMDDHKREVARTLHLEAQLGAEDVCGSYSVTGSNPQTPWITYFGELTISSKGQAFLAEWRIGSMRQRHNGIGVLVGNTLAFVFIADLSHYSDGLTQTGVVLYEFIARDALRGCWAAFPALPVGDPAAPSGDLGFEEIRKLAD